ncbi:T9SS type A sorting domain-containing protein [Aegicerativicinus sediminis]
MRSNFTLYLFLFAIFFSIQAEAQVVNKSTDTGQNGTLRKEIEDAAPGSTITFANSITTVTLSSAILIDKNLTITGSNTALTIIDAAQNGRVFTITAGTVIFNNLEITNGIESNGGGIYATNTDLTLNNCEVVSNTANGTNGSGGGVYLDAGASLTLTNSIISSNSANANGGGLRNGSGTLTINNSDIIGNTASGKSSNQGGGGIFNAGGNVTISNNTVIANNYADGTSGSGGGIFNDTDATLTILNSSIEENFASRAGGGIEDNSGNAHPTVLQNITLNLNTTGSSPGNGGGLHVTGNGTVNFTFGTISNNTAASEGGGLWNGSGNMTLTGTVVNNNTASGNASDQGGGGIFNSGGTLTLQNGVVVSNNVANGTQGSGGGVLNDMGNLNMANVEIRSNSAVHAGAGVEINSAEFSITNLFNVQFLTNGLSSPANYGAGLHVTGAGIHSLNGCYFLGNLANISGGAIYNGTGSMTLSDTDIVNNKAQGATLTDGGGGIFNNGGDLIINSNSIINTNIVDGAQGSGGGIYNNGGAVTIESSDVRSNTATGVGAGIENFAGTLTITTGDIAENVLTGTVGLGGGIHATGAANTSISTSVISANEASISGGGIYNESGTLLVEKSSVNFNVATGTGNSNGGGGIYNNSGDFTVSQSTVRNNSASGSAAAGGGIYNGVAGDLSLFRSTIAKNTSNGNGGGVYNNGNSASINAVTIAENTAGSGGGIYGDKPVTITNMIVANNSSANGADVAGSITSADYNLVETDALGVFTPMSNDIEGEDPVLGTLENNGGDVLPNGSPALTYAILEGSLAFDGGNPSDTFADQIGQPVFGAARDMGSFEAQTTLGLEDIEKLWSTRIYPNPNNGEFNIRLGSDVVDNLNLTMYSITGQTILKKDLVFGDNEFNLRGTQPGMYLLSLTDGVSKKTFKLVIH